MTEKIDSLHFIEQLIQDDLDAGLSPEELRFRFPPVFPLFSPPFLRISRDSFVGKRSLVSAPNDAHLSLPGKEERLLLDDVDIKNETKTHR